MRISVIMGVYHRDSGTDLLLRAISSILGQTFTEFEFLICDDGSCVEACNVLDALAKKDARIWLIRHGDKITLPQKLNFCLSFAKGEYIARMDDDDYSLPERFEKQAAFLKNHGDFAFVGSNVMQIREGKPVGCRVLPENPTKEDFRFVQPYIHPALMFRKAALDGVDGYSEGKRQILCEDYDLLLRLYENGYKGCNLQENLLEYTLSPVGKSSRRYRHRINEFVTRYQRFRTLGMLPRAFPYMIKPLVVGLIPIRLLEKIKVKRKK